MTGSFFAVTSWFKRPANLGRLLLAWIVLTEVHLGILKCSLRRVDCFGDWVAGHRDSGVHECQRLALDARTVLTVTGGVGSRTYEEAKLERDGHEVFNFWGTHSAIRGPLLWVEPGFRDYPVVLTYQPGTWPEVETPYGTVQPGYRRWTWDGARYNATNLPMCPLMMFLRNPIQFQE